MVDMQFNDSRISLFLVEHDTIKWLLLRIISNQIFTTEKQKLKKKIATPI